MKSLSYLIGTFAISCILAAPTNERAFNHNVRSLLRALTGDNNQQQTTETQQPAVENKDNKDAVSKPQDNVVKSEGTKQGEDSSKDNEFIQALETILRTLIDKSKDHSQASQNSKPSKYNVKARGDFEDDYIYYYNDDYDNEDFNENDGVKESDLRFIQDTIEEREGEDEGEDYEIDDEAVRSGNGWVSKNPPHQYVPSNEVDRINGEDEYDYIDDEINGEYEDEVYEEAPHSRGRLESSTHQWGKKVWI